MQKPEPQTESETTVTKVLAAKHYLTHRMVDVLSYPMKRRGRQRAAMKSGVSMKSFYQQETEQLRLSRQKTRVSDHDLLAKLGAGSWGEVFLARHKDSGMLVALKKMSKDLILQKDQLNHIETEKNVLVDGSLDDTASRMLVQLKYSFQDDRHLYLAMEYCGGGDLRTLLSHLGAIPHDCACLYMAEMILAVTALHQLGYIHRDLKPDNFLIGKDGHLKLADFGLSKKAVAWLAQCYHENDSHTSSHVSYARHTMLFEAGLADAFQDRAQGREEAMAYSVVGSPDYMAPEVLEGTGYGFEADYWSLGCMLFEFYAGYPPFHAATPSQCFANVLAHTTSLQYPSVCNDDDEPPIPPVAWDLIQKLLCQADKRLGRHGIQEIHQHPYFETIDWKRGVDALEPPFEPELVSDDDTRYFSAFEEAFPDEMVTLEPLLADTVHHLTSLTLSDVALEATLSPTHQTDGHMGASSYNALATTTDALAAHDRTHDTGGAPLQAHQQTTGMHAPPQGHSHDTDTVTPSGQHSRRVDLGASGGRRGILFPNFTFRGTPPPQRKDQS